MLVSQVAVLLQEDQLLCRKNADINLELVCTMLRLEIHHYGLKTDIAFSEVERLFASFMFTANCTTFKWFKVFCNISGATPVQPFKWFLQMVHKSFAIFQEQHQYNPSNGSQVFCNISGATPVQPFKWFTSLLQYFRSNTSTTLQMVHKSFAIFQEQHQYNPSNGHKSFAIFQEQHQYNPSNGSQVFCNISGATPVQPFKWFFSSWNSNCRNSNKTTSAVKHMRLKINSYVG